MAISGSNPLGALGAGLQALAGGQMLGNLAYLKITGKSRGDVLGGIQETDALRKDKIGVLEVYHEIVAARDSGGGHATGRRAHKPFIVIKELDRSTPALHDMLCRNEMISKWELQFWTQHGSGQSKQHYTVKLEDSYIASIKFKMPNVKTEKDQYLPYEEVAFTYRKIIWVWTGKVEGQGGQTEYQDDWNTEGLG